MLIKIREDDTKETGSKAEREDEVGDKENQAVAARELNHARQLTWRWLIFVAWLLVRHPRGPGSSMLDLLKLAAVRTAGRILQLKILRCHEYDVVTWASDFNWSALIRETCCSYAGFVQHVINFPSKYTRNFIRNIIWRCTMMFSILGKLIIKIEYLKYPQ